MSAVSESGRLESMETTLLQPRDVALEPTAAAGMPSADVELRPAWCLLAAPLAVAFAAAALVVAIGGTGATATQVIGAVLVDAVDARRRCRSVCAAATTGSARSCSPAQPWPAACASPRQSGLATT